MWFDEVRASILAALAEYAGAIEIVALPNIVDVMYGRDVGYAITKVKLPADVEAVSATKIRAGRKS
jgi:hypothetical protein